MSEELDLKPYVRSVENFPSEGIRFYDIAPLLGNVAVFSNLINELADPLRGEVTKVVGFDARGFLFGGALAMELGVGFAMLRKPGKLPGTTHKVSYDLEYGSNSLEIQTDVLDTNDKVVMIDDVIATGGTALAGVELIEKCGAEVKEFCSVIDLPHLGGSQKLTERGVAVRAMISLSGDQ